MFLVSADSPAYETDATTINRSCFVQHLLDVIFQLHRSTMRTDHSNSSKTTVHSLSHSHDYAEQWCTDFGTNSKFVAKEPRNNLQETRTEFTNRRETIYIDFFEIIADHTRLGLSS